MTIATVARRTIRRIVDSVLTVPIDRCYHYRGFRYGGFGNNLYEDYVVAYQEGQAAMRRRAAFTEALLRCRPRTMGEALQLRLVDAPLWDFPWAQRVVHPISPVADPRNNPDPVCHYCEAGVLASHINREIEWLERALDSIRNVGYRPEEYGYVSLIDLVGEKESAYIVLDGNHRISALHAAGVASVQARVSRLSRVYRSRAASWAGVVDGRYDLEAALAVFDRYFALANPPLVELNRAPLVVDEPPLWLEAPCAL